MQLFYYEDLSLGYFNFSEEESKHCVRVLRHKRGDELILIDGKGNEARAILTDDHPKRCSGEIGVITHHAPTRPFRFTLAIAPTKNFDRMEWMLEKATEIGLDEVIFIETENAERNKINRERCQKIIISALKQSKQYYLPRLHEIESLNAFLVRTQNSTAAKYIAWCPTPQTEHLSTALPSPLPAEIMMLIGPEGDFTEAETNLATQAGWQAVSLGSNILRTETAAVFVAATLSAMAYKR